MRHSTRVSLAAFAALLAASTSTIVVAKPTQAEIGKARAECRAQKEKVLAAERKSESDPQLPALRLEWEHACFKAQQLMDEASGAEPPAPAPAAEPAG